MKKWYVCADLGRPASEKEIIEIGVPGAYMYAGRVKTIVEADSPKEAIEAGKPVIEASLKPGMKATSFGCMTFEGVIELGDEEVYAKMRTV
ncbi:MAG: hypothetical protein ACI4WX_17025 [Aristaeellaceae bacterium]